MENETKLSVNLSPKRKVEVRKYKGRLIVDIREYYEKNGEQLPGSKGIALTADQYLELAKHAADIEAAIRSNSGKRVNHEPENALQDDRTEEVKGVKGEVKEEVTGEAKKEGKEEAKEESKEVKEEVKEDVKEEVN